MGVGYTITLHPAVVKEDIARLDAEWRQKIRDAIRAKLSIAPELYGFPLHHTFRVHRKLRVGDYRIVYKVRGGTVYVVKIGHRSKVYDQLLKRLRS